MQSMREYFERGFICKINDIAFTISEDIYDENGKLIMFKMKLNKELLSELYKLENKEVSLKVKGAITQKRKEEFNFERNVIIKKVAVKYIIEEENYINLEIQEIS